MTIPVHPIEEKRKFVVVNVEDLDDNEGCRHSKRLCF